MASGKVGPKNHRKPDVTLIKFFFVSDRDGVQNTSMCFCLFFTIKCERGNAIVVKLIFYHL